MVKIKLMPADTGITKVKLADDNALNTTSMDMKIKTKAPITCTFSNKLIHWLSEVNTFPFKFHLMMAAPDTFSRAYKAQYSTAFVMISLLVLGHLLCSVA